MMKIGILGGTFDPVHNEHIKMTKVAIDQLKLDKMIIMPTFCPPHKDNAIASGEDRYKMLELAFHGMDQVEVSDYELKNGGKSYTYLTVEHFREKYDCELYFIVGGDMLNDFYTWRNPEIILSKCTLCACGRKGTFNDFEKTQTQFEKTFGKKFVQLEYVGEKVSSTKIRVYSSLNLEIKDLTAPEVAKYIEEKGIYKNFEYAQFLINCLTPKRLLHTANVTITAMEKAKELNLSRRKILVSAMLHDCAKYLKKEAFKDFKLPKDVPPPVEHAFLGGYIAKNVLGVQDEEVIDAITYHTSGKANMSALAKLIFVADMIEENRDYDGVEYLRELYRKDLDSCFREALKEEVIHLKNKGQPIYKETFNAYEYYCENSHLTNQEN